MRRVVVYLIALEYLKRKMIYEAVGELKTELFKDSAEAIIPASFPPASYTYDPLGNITSKTAGPTTLGYTYHPTKKHAVSSITVNGTPYAFDYDNNGNMTSGYDLTNPLSIVTRSMSYNADNMPTVVTRNGISTSLSYDGEGARVKKTGPSGTTYYIGNHFEVSNNDPTKYIFAGNLRIAKVAAASGTYYFHKDHLGSSSAMTSDAGTVQEETNYMPFGEQREHTGLTLSNYKFTDQELDPETGLYNYDARLYDAVAGRFISADTIVPDYANPQSLNRYSYTLNNPLIYVDPTGHFTISWSSGGDFSFESDVSFYNSENTYWSSILRFYSPTIVIDPGHGDVYDSWLDSGAEGIGNKPPHEKDYALELSKDIGHGLENQGYNILYTRTGDITEKQARLQWRADIANLFDADYFISVHLNSMKDANKNYFMVGYAREDAKGLAESIANSVKQVGFSKSVAEKHSYGVLERTNAPGVLIESGNIKNINNALIISNSTFIRQIVDGINNYIRK